MLHWIKDKRPDPKYNTLCDPIYIKLSKRQIFSTLTGSRSVWTEARSGRHCQEWATREFLEEDSNGLRLDSGGGYTMYTSVKTHRNIHWNGCILLHVRHISVKLHFLFFWSGLLHAEVPEPGIRPTPQYGPKLLHWQWQILNPLSHQGTPKVTFWKCSFKKKCVKAQETISNLLWQNMMEDNRRKRMYIYVRLGRFAVQQKLTQHWL